jgi:hypothetical protein
MMGVWKMKDQKGGEIHIHMLLILLFRFYLHYDLIGVVLMIDECVDVTCILRKINYF